MNRPHKGQNQRELLALLRELGGTAEKVPSSGEVECSHPRSHRRLRINGRLKSGVPALYLLVKDAYLAYLEGSLCDHHTVTGGGS